MFAVGSTSGLPIRPQLFYICLVSEDLIPGPMSRRLGQARSERVLADVAPAAAVPVFLQTTPESAPYRRRKHLT